MEHESFGKSLEIIDTDITFDQIYEKEYVPAEYIDDIKKANLLIIPNENFREEGDVLFPETTREFYDFIRESSGDDIIPDIAVSDDNFQRIELHSAVINVATILVQWMVLPVATGMIAAFLYDLVKKYRRKPEDTSAEVNIIVEETETQKSKRIIYKGPVSGIEDALNSAAQNLFADEK